MSTLIELIVSTLAGLSGTLEILTPAAGLGVAVLLLALLVAREALSGYRSPWARVWKLAVTIVILPLAMVSLPIIAFRLAILIR